VAVPLGLNEQDVRQIEQHPENLTFDFPKDEQGRMNLINSGNVRAPRKNHSSGSASENG